jgi:hypothetical protein
MDTNEKSHAKTQRKDRRTADEGRFTQMYFPRKNGHESVCSF